MREAIRLIQNDALVVFREKSSALLHRIFAEARYREDESSEDYEERVHKLTIFMRGEIEEGNLDYDKCRSKAVYAGLL